MVVQTILYISMFIVITNWGEKSMALQYTVGDSIWSIPPTNNFYNNWSSSHSFHPGDTLLFEFEWEVYNVIQVSWAEYEACTSNHPLKIFKDGPAIVDLTQEGVFYYICNISNYCQLGQKLSVTVLPSAPSPAPPPIQKQK